MLDWQLQENDIIVMCYSAGMVLSEFLNDLLVLLD